VRATATQIQRMIVVTGDSDDEHAAAGESNRHTDLEGGSDDDPSWVVQIKEEWKTLIELCDKLKKEGFPWGLYEWKASDESDPRTRPTNLIATIEQRVEW
jgi:hypothetical protein